MSIAEKIVVYSCVTNGYDKVLPPLDPVPGVDYILFTDRPDAVSRGWQARPIDLAEGLSPSLANRYYKLLPHRALPGYTASIYLDANIQIVSSLAPFIAEVFGGDEDMVFFRHPSRTTVAEEMQACLAAKRVKDPGALKAEVADYAASGFPDAGNLTGNAILMRRHMRPAVIEAMEMWWDLVSTKSGRDQISLPYLRWKLATRDREIAPHFSLGSPYFKRYPHWPESGLRAKLYIRLAQQLDRGGPVGEAARLAHRLVGQSYGT